MAENRGVRANPLRRRAAAACTFCRRRKLKCNNERPSCGNCSAYGSTCTYEPTHAAARRSTGQTAVVGRASETRQRERRQTQAWRESQYGAAPQPQHQSEQGEQSEQHSWSSTGSASVPPQNLSRIVESANGIQSYHGQTSTLYEEQSRTAVQARPKVPDEWTEKGLVAETARQRQLEDYNFRTNKLDFDGVDPQLGMHLLSLHWNRQHHSFLVTYRPAFMRDMACNGPYFSKLLLNAIYFGAAKFSPRPEVRKDPNDVRTAGWKFRARIRELLVDSLERSEVTTIQALLVMTNSLFALGDERSAAWLYAGLAFRMIIDMGIHVDVADVATARNYSDEDHEIRRRVFWGAFVVDKIQSLYQGRPVTLNDADARVPMKFLDTYEELEPWMPFAYPTQQRIYDGSPAYSVSTFTALCKLSLILSDIVSYIYTERSVERSASDLAQMREDLHSKLGAWYDALPSHLTFGPVGKNKKPSQDQKSIPAPPPHVLSLHALYYVLLILLHRPFVADGHLNNATRTLSVNSLIICATAASNITHVLKVYDETFSVRRAPYLISYATYVAATIHGRIAAQKGPDSEAHRNLAACLRVFEENQETNSAVRRAKMIVHNLMRRLGVTVSHDETGPSGSTSTGPNPTAGTEFEEGQSHRHVTASDQDPAQADTHSVDSFGLGLNDLDFDGIIRMFTQGQEMQYPGHESALPISQRGENAGSNGVPQPQIAHEQLGRQTYGITTEAAESQDPGMDWQQGSSSAAAASAYDLIFGFNGSALDDMPMYEWIPE